MALDSNVPDVDLYDMQTTVAELAVPALHKLSEYIASTPEGTAFGTTPEAVAASLTELTNTMLGKQVTIDDTPYGSAYLSDVIFTPENVWPEALPLLLAVQAALGTIEDVEPGTDRVASDVEAAYICNDSHTPVTASSAWENISKLRAEFPTTWTATQAYYYGFCAGWPEDLALDPAKLSDTGSSLLLVAHPNELVTPGVFTTEMQAAIGGTLLTVEDDIHGSTGLSNQCGADAVTEFLRSGKTATTNCEYELAPTEG
jgi:hypothetical protein